MSKFNTSRYVPVFLAGLMVAALECKAADWSTTELQYQYGKLDTPEFAGGGSKDTSIYTFQHASGWKYGDNFFFIDWLDQNGEGFDAYGEFYPNFSLGKIMGQKVGGGAVNDVGILAGFNFGADPNVKIALPGIRLSWTIPGFAFANSDFTAYIVENEGLSESDPLSAPTQQDDGWMADFNFATKQFNVGPTKWNVEGHIEYIKQGENEFGSNADYWILAQPQLRMELGELIGLPVNTLFAGIEYQYWQNKLGDEDTDESTVQGLLVWRL